MVQFIHILEMFLFVFEGVMRASRLRKRAKTAQKMKTTQLTWTPQNVPSYFLIVTKNEKLKSEKSLPYEIDLRSTLHASRFTLHASLLTFNRFIRVGIKHHFPSIRIFPRVGEWV